MSTKETPEYKQSGTDDGRKCIDTRLRGPIPEHNRFGEYTGVTYWRCTDCGAEALNRVDLYGCCGE